MATTLKEAISDLFSMRSWTPIWRRGAIAGKRPDRRSETRHFEGLTLRLLEASRPPTTAAGRLAVGILRRQGRTSLAKLVGRVAQELYFDEMRHGGWTLDIGLYGPELFVPDAISEIRAGDGILWKIERPEGEGDEVLSALS